MTQTQPLKDRCRLILIAPKRPDPDTLLRALEQALNGGDVASLILPAHEMDAQSFQTAAEAARDLAHGRGTALMIAEDSRIAGRVGADGVHFDDARAMIAERTRRFDNALMFGAGGAKTRHEALELGEAMPDYMFFGRIGYDTKEAPHPRNLSMGEWWADLVEIPAVVMGGSTIESALEVARIRAEFVALSSAVFEGPSDPAEAVRQVNALLDESAPDLAEEFDTSGAGRAAGPERSGGRSRP